MEKDDEVKGQGNSYTTLYRENDDRLGRWLSIDPMASEMPYQSPYTSMDNNPIIYTDPNGDCPWCVGLAIAGGLIKGGIELGGQLASGKNWNTIDWVDVGAETAKGAIEGAILGTGVGGAALLAAGVDKELSIGSSLVKGAADYSFKEGNQNIVNGEKSLGDAVVDVVVDQAGEYLGGKGEAAIKKTSEKAIIKAAEKVTSTGNVVAQEMKVYTKTLAKKGAYALKTVEKGIRVETAKAANYAAKQTHAAKKTVDKFLKVTVPSAIETVENKVSDFGKWLFGTGKN